MKTKLVKRNDSASSMIAFAPITPIFVKICFQRLGISRRGSSMIEFALVIPVFALFLFGTIQYGFLLSTHLTVRNAAAVAVRSRTLYLSTRAQAVLDGQAALGTLPNGNTTPVTIHDTANSAVDCIDGNSCTATITYNLHLFMPFVVPGSAGGNLPITATSVMR